MLRGEVVFGDYVGDSYPSAWRQDSEHLGQHS